MGSCCSKGEDIVDYGPDTQPGQPDSSGVDALPAAAGDEAQVDPVTPDTLDASVAGTTLEHIADREDLSNETETMFLRLSHVSMKLMNTGRQRHSSARVVPRTTSVSSTGATSSPITIKKSNSCSTIFSDDSTVTLPNLKSTLKCASLAVFYMIKGRDRTRAPRTMDIFDEKLHPLSRDEVPAHYADFTPDHKVIYKFIKTLFHAAQLTAECAIITIIYLERLLHYAELDLHPCNWKRILLGAILLASKVWDDQAVWNVDYCQILRDITVEDMNELERVYLEQIQFNINVASSMYAKYYFDLRTLAEENAISLPNEYQPLSKERAKKIEALSFAADTKLGGKMHRSQSLEPLSPKNVVIIS